MPFGYVGGVGGNLVGDDTRADVVLVGQSEVLFRGHVAKHSCAKPTYYAGSDGARYVVIRRGDVCHERAEGVERGLVAFLNLTLHVLTDLMHRHMARALDEGLHVALPCTLHELTHSVELGELSAVVGIVGAAGAESVAK